MPIPQHVHGWTPFRVRRSPMAFREPRDAVWRRHTSKFNSTPYATLQKNPSDEKRQKICSKKHAKEKVSWSASHPLLPSSSQVLLALQETILLCLLQRCFETRHVQSKTAGVTLQIKPSWQLRPVWAPKQCRELGADADPPKFNALWDLYHFSNHCRCNISPVYILQTARTICNACHEKDWRPVQRRAPIL